jgi:glycosyltransferase involved in cell wall biosynthesis/peptidoglycan/xylan/chitin deacetylase (PgdA/CDA1 family)
MKEAEHSATTQASVAGLRVLFLIDEVASLSVGGTERQLLQIAEMASKAGMLPEIAVLRGSHVLTNEVTSCPIRCNDLRSFHQPSAIRQLCEFVAWMRRKRFHVLQTFFVESNLIGPLLGRMAGIPVILSSRRNLNHAMSPGALFRQRISNRLVTRIVANSQAVKAAVIRTESAPAGKIDVLRNGIDLSTFHRDLAARREIRQKMGVADNEILIGNTSRLYPVKCIHDFLQAAAMVVARIFSARFCIIGDGPLRQELEALAASLNIAGRVHFEGACNNMGSYLNALDMGVLCSEAEGFSNSLLEYMAMGLPCIATDVGGNREMLGEQAGLLVPAHRHELLADAMLRLLQNPQERSAFSIAARQRAAQFSVSAAQSALAEYFLTVTRGLRFGKESQVAAAKHHEAPAVERVRAVMKSSALTALRLGGVNRLLRHLQRRDLLVLCYHGVTTRNYQAETWKPWFRYGNTVSKTEFDAQLRLLAKWFQPISAGDLLRSLAGTSELPERAVLVTFDDGYRNNATLAAPVLLRHGIPAVFHVTTGYIGKRQGLWTDELVDIVLQWNRSLLPAPYGPDVPMGDYSFDARMQKALELKDLCKELPEGQRQQYLNRLREGQARSGTDEELLAFLSWEEIRTLRCQGFEIGSHTVEHPILSQVSSDQLAYELTASKERIEQETGGECYCLAYPNGRAKDVSPAVFAAAQQAGYKLGFTMIELRNDRGVSPLALYRISVPGHQPLSVFEAYISGVVARMNPNRGPDAYATGGARS